MTKIYIKYNPYTVESEIKLDGVLVQTPNKLADFVNDRLQVWIEDLMPVLEEICNDDEYEIEFYGTSLDYNDLRVSVEEYCRQHDDVKVNFKFTESKGTQDRFNELIALFNAMQKNCPFEDLKTNQIKENFQNAISSEFEISVIATMSSGKSTLINALLGRELMPSKNEACTATIAKIKDVSEMDHFEAEYLDKNGKILGKFTDLTLENMKEMNDNPATAYINIEGNIPNINSEGIHLVLVDTPGPNNSRTEEHKNHTYRIIKEKTKPMVLYVLNATQLQTNDDRELLNAVSEAMKVGGKQSKDRFLFAVNKVDLFDPDKESVQDAIENVVEYLKKFDIENPNIFPTSAEMAKVIRMKKGGQVLTKAQERTLRDYDFFIEEEQLHLSEQATLSRDNMLNVQEMVTAAQKEEDEEKEALIYTGVPAIELAIDEYLKKYAYTTKVKTAVDTFRKKVEEKDMRAKMIASIQNDEEARKEINTRLNLVKKQLEEGASEAEFRNRIKKLDMMEEANDRIAHVRKKIAENTKNTAEKEIMTELEVSQMLGELDRRIRALQSDVRTELENIIEDVINQGGQKIIEDYKKQMHLLISNGDLKTGSFNGGNTGIEFLEETIPDAQELINQFKYTESRDTGETRRVRNEDHRWWDIFELFEPRMVTRKIFEDVEVVQVEEVYEEYIAPIVTGFNQNVASATKAAQQEAEKFKQFFLNELKTLNLILKKKVAENEKLTRDHESIERKIKEDQEKVQWLEQFLNKLDGILQI